MIGFVCCHGWACRQRFWEKLAPTFSKHPLVYWNAGYFESKNIPDLDPSVQWVGIGHSLGFAKLVMTTVPWHKLISLGGFTRFSSEKVGVGVPSTILKTMQQNLREDPSQALLEFYGASGLSDQGIPEAIDNDLLYEDLGLLNEIDCHERLKKMGIPTLAIASETDPIIPWPLSQASFEDIPNAQLITIDHSGHGIGYHHVKECKKYIEAFIYEDL